MSFPERLEAGSPYPLGSTFDGMGVNFAVYSANAERIELCLFDPNGRKEIARFDLPEWTDEVWHGYLPDALPGLVYGYRAYGPVRAGKRPPVQSSQAAARSLRQAARGRAQVDGQPVRLPSPLAQGGPFVRSPRQRPGDAQGRRYPRVLRLVARPAAEYAVGRNGDLRSACARVDQAVRGGRPAGTRHLCRARQRPGHRSPQAARHYRNRTAADPRLRAGPLPARKRADQLLGLQLAVVLRARAAIFRALRTSTNCGSRCAGSMPRE